MKNSTVCPACGYLGPAPFEDCPDCGIVVEKYLRMREIPLATHLAGRLEVTPDPNEDWRSRLSDWLLLLPEDVGGPGLLLRGGLLLVLVLWGFSLISAPPGSNGAGESFLHMVNLPFHEAGHIFLAPFGRFITSLGGTLFQLLIPLVCAAALIWKRQDPFGGAAAIWWFGENFVDIAPYINDARAGVLPLLGGNTGQTAPYGFHDWQYLLNETGLLAYDQQIAAASHWTGAILMLLATVWGGTILYCQFNRPRSAAGPFGG